jgi:uncharacterized protein YybS (DUF2232 family)
MPQIGLTFLPSYRTVKVHISEGAVMKTLFALVLLALTLASGMTAVVSPSFAGPKQPIDCTKCK